MSKEQIILPEPLPCAAHYHYDLNCPRCRARHREQINEFWDEIRQRCYVIIYKNWMRYLVDAIPKHKQMKEAVIEAQKNITADLYPWATKKPMKYWNEALDDLPRKMEPTFVPVKITKNTIVIGKRKKTITTKEVLW